MKSSRMVVPEWKFVEKYLETETTEGAMLALFEADKIFEEIAATKKGAKCLKDREAAVAETVKELRNPESFLSVQKIVKEARDKIGEMPLDLYGAQSMVEVYRDTIGEILFDDIDEASRHSWRYVLWPAYHRLFWSRKKIVKVVLWILFFIALILFIADTQIGALIFDTIVGQIHTILRFLIIVLLVLFLVAFVIASFLVFLDSRRAKRRGKG